METLSLPIVTRDIKLLLLKLPSPAEAEELKTTDTAIKYIF